MNLVSGARAEFIWRDMRLGVTAPDRGFIDGIGQLIGLSPGPIIGADRQLDIVKCDDGFRIQGDGWQVESPASLDALVTAAAGLAWNCYWTPALQFLHGAAVIIDDAAHLLLGPNRVGKSRLILAAWQAGIEILGDDFLLVNPEEGTIEATPVPVRARHPVPTPTELAGYRFNGGRVGDEPSLLLGRDLPRLAPIGRRYPVRSIALLERAGPLGRTSRYPAARMTVLDAILRYAGFVAMAPMRIFRSFEPAITAGNIYHLTIGDDDSAAACRLIG